MTHQITVCIASIPPRAKKLRQAVSSVLAQTYYPKGLAIDVDEHRTGAAATKNRALAMAQTDWVAFLDDDDQMMPEHLEKLVAAQLESGADVIYSRPYIPQIQDHEDPSGRHGQPFDADELRKRSYIQTTSLIRTEAIRAAGGFQLPDQAKYPGCVYDDWGLWLAMLDTGASFYHLNEQTFVWNHWEGNTSGLPTRW